MPFDLTSERHFYFGDIFFENFAGIFDFASGKVGMALSQYAPETVSFACAGDSCVEPEPIPDPPTPDPPTPEPHPVPSESSDSHLMWLWIVIALVILIILVLLIACYYRRKAKQQKEMNAIIYGAGIGHDGDLIEKDVSGKGANRTSQFTDHEELMRETEVETPFDEDEDDGIGGDRGFNNQFGQGKPLMNDEL